MKTEGGVSLKTNFQIDGVTIKRPHSFKTEFYNITKSNRLANGDMSMDLIAQKRKFYFTWDAIDANDAKTILDLLWYSKKVFYTLTYVEDNITKTAVVYTGSIPKELHMSGDVWVWKNFSFNLIER